ncbi:S26 family signal peptidase [Pseudogemmobacter bohemicus]
MHGDFFLMEDNRPDSMDSRRYGSTVQQRRNVGNINLHFYK